MAFKLSALQMALIALGIFVVVALVMGVRATTKKDNFEMDPYGEYVVGGVKEGVRDFVPEGQQVPDPSHQYHLSGGYDEPANCDECAARGADRENGYGTKYHIVGNKCYECNNDPNDLTTMGCRMDDFSQWQTDDLAFKDFNHNPLYGKNPCNNACGLNDHDQGQNPYNPKDGGCGACGLNPNPRHTFDVNDPFTPVPVPLSYAKY